MNKRKSYQQLRQEKFDRGTENYGVAAGVALMISMVSGTVANQTALNTQAHALPSAVAGVAFAAACALGFVWGARSLSGPD